MHKIDLYCFPKYPGIMSKSIPNQLKADLKGEPDYKESCCQMISLLVSRSDIARPISSNSYHIDVPSLQHVF